MSLDVLTPVAPRRRRRPRYWLRRLVALVVVAAGGAGIALLLGRHGTAAAHHRAATPRHHHPVRKIVVRTVAPKPSQPLVLLLHGPPLLKGQLHRRLLSPEAILVDAGTGRVLWEKRPHQHRAIASTTKIMTALLALREVPWHSTITVARASTRVPLVKEGLRTGERVPAWKLFYAALLYSGNDDATQLAISSAGTVHGFLRQMNAEARRLGLRDTHYTSPSGVIDKGNYSTAWDLAALTRYALRNPRFREVVRRKQIRVGWAPPTNWKLYVNNNWLLHKYRGANGVKTGYTAASGWCLVASATRHGRTLIAVVLDSRNMYRDARRLLDLGFGR